jgi:hypothetical protein
MTMLRFAGLFLLAGAAIAADSSHASPQAAGGADRPVPIAMRAERAQVLWHVQGDAGLDHPVGDAITLLGTAIPAHLADKGALELDVARDGHFKPAKGVVTVSVPKREGKGNVKLDLLLTKGEDGAWRYRTLTQLTVQIGTDRLVVIDVDGDGAFNHAGVDAMAWAGDDYAFPLPSAGERWCTPTLDLSGLAFGELGEEPKVVGRPLAANVTACLAVLKGINEARAGYGLTPRPEEPALSAALQKHCHYMVGTGKLAHPEEPGNPNYSEDGNAAGMSSILGMGHAPESIAAGMIMTFYHRQDVVRPQTLAFGLGFEGQFGGIDGRRALGAEAHWPVLVPEPDQYEVPLRFAPESPDPIGGARDAGFPITAYFDSPGLVLKSWKLEALPDRGQPRSLDCYTFDSRGGGDVNFNGFQKVVGLVPKEPLAEATRYRVALTVEVDGKDWKRTWEFATVGTKRK